MSDPVAWPQAYLESHRRVAGVLMSVRRKKERTKACLKVLVNASEALTFRAPAAISEPAADHSTALAEIAGAAWAARDAMSDGGPHPRETADPAFLAWLAQRSRAWGGELASPLMAASDGEMRTLLYGGAVAELEARAQAGDDSGTSWLTDPAYRIDHAAAFLAELTAVARPRPAAAHQARAQALDQELANTYGYEGTHITAHAFAVHHLTGVYGPGDGALRDTMLRFVATHPPHERASLQASKVAALLSDALGTRARMAVLDHILVLLGPGDGDPSVRMPLARDDALVLLLLESDGGEPAEATEVVVATPVSVDAQPRGLDALADIVGEAERSIGAAAVEQQARYQAAVEAGSLAEALEVVRDAAADGDPEQAWSMLREIADRHPDADARDLVVIGSDVLGPVALDGAEDFEGPGAGCFTILSPAPAQAAAAIAPVATRLLFVDDLGVEHPDADTAADTDAYTPNFLHDIGWCDRGAQVMLDTKGAMSAAMGRTMVAILVDALVADRVPALVTGWIPDLEDRMTPWSGEG